MRTSLMVFLLLMSVLQTYAQPKEKRYISQFKGKALKVQKWCEADLKNRVALYLGKDDAIVSVGQWKTAKANARISFNENGMVLNGFMGFVNDSYTIAENTTPKETLESPLCAFSKPNEKDINVNVYQIKGNSVILAFRISYKWYIVNCIL